MSKKEYQGSSTCSSSTCGNFNTLQNYASPAMSGPQAPLSTVSPIAPLQMRVPQFGSVSYIGSTAPTSGSYTNITSAYPVSGQCMTSYLTKSCQ